MLPELLSDPPCCMHSAVLHCRKAYLHALLDMQPDRRAADFEAVMSPICMGPAMTWLCTKPGVALWEASMQHDLHAQHSLQSLQRLTSSISSKSALMLLPDLSCRASGSAGSWVQHIGES